MKRLFVLTIALLFTVTAWAGDNKGLISKKSSHSVKVTLDRMEKILKKKGITNCSTLEPRQGRQKGRYSTAPYRVIDIR